MERDNGDLVRSMVPIVLFICIAATTIGFPIAKAYARRMDRGPREPSRAARPAARLERMEQALDSIAIEVERISEGQRFTTKLLAERATGDEKLPERANMITSDQGDDIPPEVVELVKAFFFTVSVIALGSPIIRAFTRRWERGRDLRQTIGRRRRRDSSASSRRSKRSRSKSSASPKRSASRPS